MDHGYVKLLDWMGTDESIIEAARMSTGRGFEGWDPVKRCKKCLVLHAVSVHYTGGDMCADDAHEWEVTKGDQWLLAYLYENRHMTPFEMCELKIEVQAPLMVFREWHRHRTQSYNEFSARYSQMANLHYMPLLSRIQKQSATNKQGSAEAFPEEYAAEVIADMMNEQQQVYQHYEKLVNDGVAKEVARLNTPVSRYSKMVAKANLRNWLAFLTLRDDGAAQWEIRQYADVVGRVVRALWPRVYGLWEDHTKYAVTFSAPEMAVLREMIRTDEVTQRAVEAAMGPRAKKFMAKLGK